MNSRVTEDFVALFSKLPESVQQRARRNYRTWLSKPSHPSLHFKRIHASEPLYSARVGRGWRVVGLLEDNTMSWFWIGSHADYDNLLKQL